MQSSHDRSIGGLLRELAAQTAALVRAEIDLARAELAEKAVPLGASAGALGAAALFGLGAFGALTATLILAIAVALPAWAAALIVTAAYGVLAAMLALAARRRLARAKLALPKTTQTIKDDVEWAKARTKSATRSKEPARR